MSFPKFQPFPKLSRLFREITITEKLDGTNSSIFIDENNQIFAASRNRWITPESDNFGFARWVETRKSELLELGPGHHFGEWVGCLTAETSIRLADGSLEKLGKIVRHQLPLEVLSYNFSKGALEAKRVVGWKEASPTEEWLTIDYSRQNRGGRSSSMHVTPNHIVFVKRGHEIIELDAGSLKIGDTLLTHGNTVSVAQEQLLKGSILGDGSIEDYCFTVGHSLKEYTKTKERLLGPLVSRKGEYISGHGSIIYRLTTKALPVIRAIQEELYASGKKQPTYDYVLSLGPLALAFWYGDDGSIVQGHNSRRETCVLHTNGFSVESVEAAAGALAIRGYSNYIIRDQYGYPEIKFTPDGTEHLHLDIAPFMAEEVRYKLLEKLRNGKNCLSDLRPSRSLLHGLVETKIVAITDRFARGNRCKKRYDIEIEDNHNFFANNILVHNSGIQRNYGLRQKRFVLFNTHRWTESRPACCDVVPVLYQGAFSEEAIRKTLSDLEKNGSVLVPGFMNPEGIVILHHANRQLWKVTLGGDGHKGEK